jgi:hypothetical protein
VVEEFHGCGPVILEIGFHDRPKAPARPVQKTWLTPLPDAAEPPSPQARARGRDAPPTPSDSRAFTAIG